jgi:hypothetical protein
MWVSKMTHRWAVAIGIVVFGIALATPFREWVAITLLRAHGYVPTDGWHVDGYLNGRRFNSAEQSPASFRRALSIFPWCPSVNRVVVPPMPDLRETLARLATMDHIVAIDLADKAVTDDDLAGLAGMKNLAFLDVSRNPAITDAGVENLADLKNLRYLNLTQTSVTGAGLKDRFDMVNLEYLSLNDCPVTDESLAAIPTYAKLEQLFLGRTQVTDQGLLCLVGSPSLRRVTRSAAMTQAGARSFNDAFLAARREAREAGEPVSDRDRPPVFMENWRDDL